MGGEAAATGLLIAILLLTCCMEVGRQTNEMVVGLWCTGLGWAGLRLGAGVQSVGFLGFDEPSWWVWRREGCEDFITPVLSLGL